jgi:ethanolamine transporter EutH
MNNETSKRQIFASQLVAAIVAVPLAVLIGYLLSRGAYELAVSDTPEPQDVNEAIQFGDQDEITFCLICAATPIIAVLAFCVIFPLTQRSVLELQKRDSIGSG